MRILVLAVVLIGLSGPAAAQSEADRAAIQGVIGQQLDAFLRMTALCRLPLLPRPTSRPCSRPRNAS
jgi:hypothetical protein